MFLAQNVFSFFRNGSSYSFETCTIVIIRPENLRVHWVWPSKYKEKWCFSPKCVFLRNGSLYSFETCTIVIIMPENLRVHWVWSSKYKEKWCFIPKCVFFRNGSSYSFETCTTVIITPENLRVHWVWSSKYKEKWCFSPKCVFLRNGSSYSFETCTIVIIRPENLRVHWVWSSKYKESDALAQNVLFASNPQGALSLAIYTALKLVPLWSSPLPENLRVHWVWYSKYKEKWCFSPKCVFFQKWIIIQLWNLHHCDHWHLKTSECTEFGPLNTKKSDGF